jgi:hypothetical protein
MVNVTVADLMSQLAQEWAALEPRPDEFTAAQFAERTGKERKAADYFLEQSCKDKRLKRRMGLTGGKRTWLYSSANKD